MSKALTWCWEVTYAFSKLTIDLLVFFARILATSAGLIFSTTKTSKKETGKVRHCSAELCSHDFYAKGYCKRHYTQILRHGRLTPERERGNDKTCSAATCDRKAKGYLPYCRKHARQIKRHGRLTPEREKQYGNTGCLVSGCRWGHRSRGLCTKHYAKARYRYIATRYKNNKPKSFDAIIREMTRHEYV